MLIDNKINIEYIYKRSLSLQMFDEIKDKLNSLLKLTNSDAFLEMWNSVFYNELDNPEYLILNKNLSEIIKGLNVISR